MADLSKRETGKLNLDFHEFEYKSGPVGKAGIVSRIRFLAFKNGSVFELSDMSLTPTGLVKSDLVSEPRLTEERVEQEARAKRISSVRSFLGLDEKTTVTEERIRIRV